MRRIIGTIAATLAVAATLGVGLVLTTNAVPQVAAAPAGGVQGHGTMDTYAQALASGNVDEVLVKAQALASGNVDEVLVTSDVGSRVDHRMLYASWVPLADPAGGPNFFPLDEDARYYAANWPLPWSYDDEGTTTDVSSEAYAGAERPSPDRRPSSDSTDIYTYWNAGGADGGSLDNPRFLYS
jgi:hypothetical protein